jgi:hypothetical protein
MLDKLNKMIDKQKFIVFFFTIIFSGFGGWFVSGKSKSILEEQEVKNSLIFYTDANGNKKLKRVGNGEKPFLIEVQLDSNDTVCLPDPYVIFEQTLLWEIDYLEYYIYELPAAKENLITKSNELMQLRKDCLKKYNILKKHSNLIKNK